MGTVIMILILLVCVFLMAVVMVQNSKGGGLAAGFSSSNQILGVRRTNDFLEQATWGLAIALLALCLLSSALTTGTTTVSQEESQIKDAVSSTVIPPSNFQNPQPQQAPAQQQQPAQQPAE